MIARLSQTTVSPSQRMGTLPSDGANSSPSRRFAPSASNIGTTSSSNSSPYWLHASHPRIDQLEYARLPMISLNKLVSLGRCGIKDCRSQLGNPATGFTRRGEDGGVCGGMPGGLDRRGFIKGPKGRRLHLVTLRQYQMIADCGVVEHAHHIAIDFLEAVPRIDEQQGAFQDGAPTQIIVHETAPPLDEIFWSLREPITRHVDQADLQGHADVEEIELLRP